MFIRLLFILLCVALVGATIGMYLGTTQEIHDHVVTYVTKYTSLSTIREWSMFGVLGASILLARRDPNLVRLGLLAVIFASAFLLLPPRTIHQAEHEITSAKQKL